MPVFVPAILEKNTRGLEEKLKLIDGLTDYIQLDIIDGWPEAVDTISLTDLKKVAVLRQYETEIHLMVRNPINYLAKCRLVGPKMVYGQIEQMSDQSAFIRQCRQLGMKGGLALDLPSFLGKIDKAVYYQTDGVLLMSVKAGGQRQKFNKKVLGKLKRLVRIKKDIGADFKVSIDGGINRQTASWCLAGGANQLCVGSYLLTAVNIKKAWQELNGFK